MYPLDDTIAAIASAPGGAARGIVRVSGPNTARVIDSLFSGAEFSGDEFSGADGQSVSTPTASSVTAGSLVLPTLRSPLPCELYLWPSGRSYTGGLLAEIHTLGSPPLLQVVLRAICEHGARMAEPGEFTLRAFLAGRIDLTQAEAVLGVIDAADPQQLDVALTQLAGGLAGPLNLLRDDLLELLAHLEAGFDFADEDLPFITPDRLESQLAASRQVVAKLAEQMASRVDETHLVRAALIGPPNAGKSSLFNTLAQDAGAIVSHLPHTTRDYLTAELDLDGVRCQLIDTAGTVGETAFAEGDKVDPDLAAQAATSEQRRVAHVTINCIDANEHHAIAHHTGESLDATDNHVVVLTKIDLLDGPTRGACDAETDTAVPIATSAKTGEGIDRLRRALREAVLAAGAGGAGVVAGTAARCRESLRRADESLDRAIRLVREQLAEELVAAELRRVLDELGRVVGAVYTDDVLDRIFSRFCIGK